MIIIIFTKSNLIMETQGKFIVMTVDEFQQFLVGTVVARKITHIQNHHTLIPSYRNFNGSNHFEKMQAMEADHIARGFGGIAQHITTFPDGKIGLGRKYGYKTYMYSFSKFRGNLH